MNATKVTEVIANQGLSCAFKSEDGLLGVAKRDEGRLWCLRLSNGEHHHCEDFDEMRDLIRAFTPSGHAFFVRRRIMPRQHFHGRLAAA